MHPGRSAVVAPLDFADLHAIYRLRRTLEHVDLIAAFRRRDPDAAADAVNTHLTHNETIAHHALTPRQG